MGAVAHNIGLLMIGLIVALPLLMLLIKLIQIIVANLFVIMLFIVPPFLFISGIYLMLNGNYFGIAAIVLSIFILLNRRRIANFSFNWKRKLDKI